MPTLNVTAINLGYLIGGVVIVEKVFSIQVSADSWSIRSSIVIFR